MHSRNLKTNISKKIKKESRFYISKTNFNFLKKEHKRLGISRSKILNRAIELLKSQYAKENIFFNRFLPIYFSR